MAALLPSKLEILTRILDEINGKRSRYSPITFRDSIPESYQETFRSCISEMSENDLSYIKLQNSAIKEKILHRVIYPSVVQGNIEFLNFLNEDKISLLSSYPADDCTELLFAAYMHGQVETANYLVKNTKQFEISFSLFNRLCSVHHLEGLRLFINHNKEILTEFPLPRLKKHFLFVVNLFEDKGAVYTEELLRQYCSLLNLMCENFIWDANWLNQTNYKTLLQFEEHLCPTIQHVLHSRD